MKKTIRSSVVTRSATLHCGLSVSSSGLQAIALAVVAALSLGHSAQATTYNWKNTGTDWNTAGDWNAATVPGTATTDIAGFNVVSTGANEPNISASVTLAGVNFSTTASSGYTISSSGSAVTLTLLGTGTGSAGVVNGVNTSGTNTISAPIILGAAAASTQTITQADGGTLALIGPISSTNSITLAYNGNTSGAFNITGTNTYTGLTTLTSGIFNLGNSAAFSSGAVAINGVTIIATTDLSGASKLANTFTLGATNTFQGSNNIELGGLVTQTNTRTTTNNLDSGKTLTLSGGLALSSGASNYTATFNGSGSTLISGVIANGGTASAAKLTYSGTGSLTLSNTNTYTGVTTVSGGTLKVTSAGSINSASAITVGVGGTYEYNSSANSTNAITLNGTLKGNGSGTSGALILSIGGLISPGATGGTAIDTLKATSLTWNEAASSPVAELKFDLSNNSNASDLLSLSGAFTKGTGTGSAGSFVFDFNGTGFKSTPGPTVYTLASFTSTTFLASDFSYVNLGANQTGIFALTGTTLTLSVVPEPSTWGMILGSLGLLVAAQQLRRRA